MVGVQGGALLMLLPAHVHAGAAGMHGIQARRAHLTPQGAAGAVPAQGRERTPHDVRHGGREEGAYGSRDGGVGAGERETSAGVGHAHGGWERPREVGKKNKGEKSCPLISGANMSDG